MRRLTVFAFLTAFSVALSARADDKAEAKRQFDAGVSLLKAENYEGAAASFEASLELFPTKTALFNLANCYKTLQRYDEALAALFRLRRDFAGKLGAEMEEATAAIEREIRNLVGTLNVEVDRPDAMVVVDGREVGVSPLSKPVLLAPGSHEVTARLFGVDFPAEKVRMLAGRELSVRLEGAGDPHPGPLPPAGEGAGTRADEGASPPSPRSLPSPESAGLAPAWFWTGLGATAVFGGVTLGMNFAVRGQKDELATDAELERAERMQSAGIAFLALTGAAAVTTVVLAFFTDWDDESPHPGPPPGGEGVGTGGSARASIPFISSIPSIDGAPAFFATDSAGGVGIAGRF